VLTETCKICTVLGTANVLLRSTSYGTVPRYFARICETQKWYCTVLWWWKL